MRWLTISVITVVFGALTGLAFMASARGWGLPGALDRPVSVREESVGGQRRGAAFLYFGSRHHAGGGYRGGK
jgi:hypothetical protein